MLNDRFSIRQLGQNTISSSVEGSSTNSPAFTLDSDLILYDDSDSLGSDRGVSEKAGFEMAGAREKLFFAPGKVRAGIVTCGGLCPGLNDVIRALVMTLWHSYGIRDIYGFQNGYQGLVSRFGHSLYPLTPEVVDGWQDLGGTKLGSSRGEQSVTEIVDTLEQHGISLFFPIGGDGTMRGAQDIADEITRRKLSISVVGIPKTIDNDILCIDESFGFQSAYEAAGDIIRCAHVEAKGAPNGIGLVKLMGRHSGFIACYAALSVNDVNLVLIPEMPFSLDGAGGLLEGLAKRLAARKHAVIVVAEGAGQHLIEGKTEQDRSGNVKFHDVGVYLKARIESFFSKQNTECNVRYIDPSYAIRGVPANAYDSVYCLQLGHAAVHAAMAGKTEMLVGKWHGRIVHIPMSLVTEGRKQVDPKSPLWQMVLESTGQQQWLQ